MRNLQTRKIVVLMIILATIFIFNECKKTNAMSTGPVNTVTGSVAGLVVDQNNDPAANVAVTAGKSSTSTGSDGKFDLQHAELNSDAGFVIVNKDGYFNGSRTFLVNTTTTNNVKIMLIPKTVSGIFPSSSGGKVNIAGGGSVNFSSGAVVNATSNSSYSGDVSVSTFYLNPTDSNFKNYMPGNKLGIGQNNMKGIIRFFGMATIELNDGNGQKLQLASGKSATITLPIPAALQATAPASIPLWYFDETSGIWKQQGSATKNGTDYVGTVAHFSFWAAGDLLQDITLTATFKDSSGNALANKLVTINSATYGATNGYTDSAGMVSGFVPANDNLAIFLYSDCGVQINYQDFNTSTVDINLGIIIVSNNGSCAVNDSSYINLTFNGSSYSWTSAVASSIDSGSQFITDITALNNNYINLGFYSQDVPGTYILNMSMQINNISYAIYSDSSYATVSDYGAVGGYISGTASGWVRNYTGGAFSGAALPISCTYRVTRTQ